MKKIILLLTISVLVLTPVFVVTADCDSTTGVCSPAGTDTLWTPESIAAKYIRIGVGFLGIIALLFFMYAGFLWMTAQGKPDVIKKARDMMIWAVLGIVVILSSYTLLSYIFENMDSVLK